jgi:hypothetical protein
VPARLGLLALLAATLACGGDGGGGGMQPGVSASFTASATAAAPDLARLRAGAAAGDTVTVEVALSGPTTSGDIFSFAFDLVLSDASVARYVAGSAAIGDALVPAGAQTRDAFASQNGNRVIVSATKLGGGAGNAVAAGEHVVVSLVFRLLRAGSTTVTFAGSTSPQDPTNDPAALDSTGAVIPSVVFDAAAGTLVGI